jgi:hypothetical protein
VDPTRSLLPIFIVLGTAIVLMVLPALLGR